MILSHNDNPALDDAFGQDAFLAEVCTQISTCVPPKGIGINGYWGTGKTSALLQVYRHLTNELPYGENSTPGTPSQNHDGSILPVWFEAWRYQHESLPIVALLNEIRQQLGLWAAFQQKAKKLGSVALLGAISAFDETVKAASGGLLKPEFGKIQQIGNTWEKERFQKPLEGQVIRTLMQEAIQEILKSKEKNKLVIFIDDLDRCEPATALRLMEGIKIYLSLNNCVIVFGMDQRQVERALATALALPGGNDAVPDTAYYAGEYLEKICQDIIHLPLANQQQKSYYLHRLLLDILESGENSRAKGFADQLQKITDEHDCLPANPRKIKALANRLASMIRRHTSAAEATDSSPTLLEAKLCFIVAILYCFHRSVYEQLQRRPEYIQDVLAYAGDSDTTQEKYSPMKGIRPSMNGSNELPVNPSDSNVFRLHQLLVEMETITAEEIKPFVVL